MSATTDETITIGEVEVRFLLEGDASGGSVAVFEFTVPAGARVPLAHSHDGYEETVYGLDGTLAWTVEDRQVDVGPGDMLCLSRGVLHRFDDERDADARMLAIVTPASSGRTTSARWPRWSGRRGRQEPAEPGALAAVMRRHGLTPAP